MGHFSPHLTSSSWGWTVQRHWTSHRWRFNQQVDKFIFLQYMVCIYIYLYICKLYVLYIYVYICIYIYIFIFILMYIRMCVYIDIKFAYICIYVTYVYISYIHTHSYVYNIKYHGDKCEIFDSGRLAHDLTSQVIPTWPNFRSLWVASFVPAVSYCSFQRNICIYIYILVYIYIYILVYIYIHI